MSREEYETPQIEHLGGVADLTTVGQTTPGTDSLGEQAEGKDEGSINPPGLD